MEPIKAIYTGNGDFLQGIPARDLTVSEWDGLSEEKQQLLKDLGLFRLKPGPTPQVEEEIESEGEQM